MKKLSTLLVTVIFLSGISFAQVSEGDDAPNFTLTSLENMQIELAQLEGKVVYIFFFGANCPHCRDNGPITEDEIYQTFKDDDNFFAVGIDTWNTSAASVNNFKSVTGITYTLLLNGEQTLVDYYGNTSSYDRSVVISADGKVAYKGNSFVNNDFEEVNETIEDELALATSIDDPDNEIPSQIILNQNYPNPFNPSTSISYSIPEASDISITIYNMLGVQVATIDEGLQSAGEHEVTFDATNLSSGIYIYRLNAGNASLTKRMTLVK